MDVFISYNHASSKKEAYNLFDTLTLDYGYKVWLDRDQLFPGMTLHGKISKAISDSKVFICCITREYCASKNCNLEFNYADEENKPMIVLMIDNIPIGDIFKIKITNTNNDCGIGMLIR
jgi:hypothetical protein